MKKQFFFFAFAAFALITSAVFAQDKDDKSKRPSPPAKAEGTVDGAKIVIDYSQPSVKGRKIFGGLEPYGQVWRTGANETTTFEVSKDVKVEGKTLAKGKYALFTIPGEKEWTVIFNKTIKWGAYDYKEAEDVLRVKVPAGKTKSLVEKFTIAVEGNKVVLRWENTEVAFAVKG
jgi:opacity protein-like surface antigen